MHDLNATKWNCSRCKEDQDISDNYCIALDENTTSRCIKNLLDVKTRDLLKNHHCNSGTEDQIKDLNIKENVQVCIFYSLVEMEVELDKPLEFGGHTWKCSSAVTRTRSVFHEKSGWFFCEDKTLKITQAAPAKMY